MRMVYVRPDKPPRPRTGLRVHPIRAADGWCDAPRDRNYNRPVRHPYPASAEHMWRRDGLYDIVVVLGYNDRPRIAGRGSAVFLHVAEVVERHRDGQLVGLTVVQRSHDANVVGQVTQGLAAKALERLPK